MCRGQVGVVAGVLPGDVIDEAGRARLRQLWLDHGLIIYHGLIIFRGSDASVELQIALSAALGPLERHFQEDRVVEGHVELVSFSADPVGGHHGQFDGETLVGFIPWHGDSRWMARPSHGGILRVRRMPARGGDTGFIDLIGAYDRLPDELKARIAGRETIIQFGADPEVLYRFITRHRLRVVNPGTALETVGARRDFLPIVQPLVFTQPESGRRVLGFSPLSNQHVAALDPQNSEELLHALAAHVTDETHAYFHRWQEGDLVLWDNLRMLHQACGVPPGEEREVWRTTIASSYPIARTLEDDGWE